ncbi:MAG: hypothetical protein AAB425_07595, partial [Bdellovibrionota bacterium]
MKQGKKVFAQVLNRFVAGASGPYSVAHIFHLVTGKPSDWKSHSEFVEPLRRALGVKNWLSAGVAGSSKKTQQFSGILKVGSNVRVLRIFVRDLGDQISYSIAVIRETYSLPTILEADRFQLFLAGEFAAPSGIGQRVRSAVPNAGAGGDSSKSEATTPNAPWSAMIFQPWLPSAFAVECPESCASRDWSCFLNMLNCNGTHLNRNWHDTNDQLEEWQTQAEDANANFADFNDQLGIFNTNIENLDDLWGNTNEIAAAGMKNWEVTNGLISQFLDPQHMFVLAGATAAGAALGGAAVGLAIDGLVAGGAAIIEAIKGKSDEEIEASFAAAIAHWEKLNSTVSSMEAMIDSSLKLREKLDALPKATVRNTDSKGKTRTVQRPMSNEEIVSAYAVRVKLLKAEADTQQEELIRATERGDSMACRMAISEGIVVNEQEIALLESIIGNLSGDLESKGICSEIDKFWGKLSV